MFTIVNEGSSLTIVNEGYETTKFLKTVVFGKKQYFLKNYSMRSTDALQVGFLSSLTIINEGSSLTIVNEGCR